MNINCILKEKNISKYRLAKECKIPYSTINDICSGKTRVEKCTAENIYKIAKVLGVTMESILEPYIETRCDFELFKSNICHRLKEKGDIEYLIEILEKDEIGIYYRRGWHLEAFYLLGMLDYLSRENSIPICSKYSDMRKFKLDYTVYPSSILVESQVSNNQDILKEAIKESIPEFIRFNIVENGVRDVI